MLKKEEDQYEQDDYNSRILAHNSDEETDPLGPPHLITPQHIREMERILENEGIEGRSLTWEQLGFEIGLDVSGRTIQRIMGARDYHKCITCSRGWVSPETARHRKEWSTVMYERYPGPEDWENVRFSDEVHYGYGPMGM